MYSSDFHIWFCESQIVATHGLNPITQGRPIKRVIRGKGGLPDRIWEIWIWKREGIRHFFKACQGGKLGQMTTMWNGKYWLNMPICAEQDQIISSPKSQHGFHQGGLKENCDEKIFWKLIPGLGKSLSPRNSAIAMFKYHWIRVQSCRRFDPVCVCL